MPIFTDRQKMAVDAINFYQRFPDDLALDAIGDLTFAENDSFVEVRDWDLGLSWWVEDCRADELGPIVHELKDCCMADIHSIAADFMVTHGFLRRDGDVEQIKHTYQEVSWEDIKIETLNHELDYLATGRM